MRHRIKKNNQKQNKNKKNTYLLTYLLTHNQSIPFNFDPMQTSTSTPRAQREEEEALIVALFKGTVAIEENNNNNNNKKAKLDSQQEVNEQLLKAEQKFLSSHAVTTENVKLSDVAARFKDSAMPVRSTEPGGYVNALISNAVNDSVNVSSPVMIGHMTSSLPFYARPLSRLVTTMNQNSVKTETANTVTFLERQALAELHRVLYKNNDAFYAKYVGVVVVVVVCTNVL